MKFTAKNAGNLAEIVFRNCEVKKTNLKTLLRYKKVRVNEKIVYRIDIQVKEGDIIEVDFTKQIKQKTLYHFPYKILFEDQYFIAAEKPAGMLSSGKDLGKKLSFFDLINAYVRTKSSDKERAYIIHRIDREVSGILIYTKKEHLKEQMQELWPDTKKYYYAFVEGCPKKDSGTVRSHLAEDKNLRVYSTKEGENTKLAITHYTVIKKYPENTLLQIQLETGRKNQIRVHLSEMGCPIVGDRKYGADDSFVRRIRLHAYYFEFVHPVTNQLVKIETKMPSKFTVVSKENENYK